MQKEFTFLLPGNASNGQRVARPTRFVPLGQALERNGLKSGPRTAGGGGGSVVSTQSASISKRYSMSLLTAPGLAKPAIVRPASTHGDTGSRGRGSVSVACADDRRPRSASRHRSRPSSMAKQRGGSLHHPVRRYSDWKGHAGHTDDDDDSFGADDQDGVEWWDDCEPAATQTSVGDVGSRPSIKASILKSKLEGRYGGSQAQNQTPPAKLRDESSHNSSGFLTQPPLSCQRLDQVIGSSDSHAQLRRSRDYGGDDDKSLHSSATSNRRKSNGATKVRSGSRHITDAVSSTFSKNHAPRQSNGELDERELDERPRPRSSTMPSPSRNPLRSSLLRGRVQTRSKSATPSRRSRSERQSSAHSASSPAAAPPQPVLLSPSSRVKHGRVSRPVSAHSKAESEHFGPSEDYTSGLPLQVQRRGRYGDKETMFKKVQQIGINEQMLWGMKKAGLVITEGQA